uniref:NADH dehydrogenase subunit 4L n=1 Tax=Rhipicephalus simus TaxID=72861 RepID=UPI002237B431|nr:NADH dehydrogenase subunit 4L [Rhipicephalus simus]QLD97333.1 NADH dehydrogenase subunit 4L [Rhipicephalus simus]UYB78844.1 NADH dehydrogenase subunit 4L [Rhipicephalus simus]
MATLIIILYFIGMLALFINRYYLMMVLLSIEFIYMSLLLMLCIYFCLFNLLGIFTFLISIVCEAGLGLSLLVMMSFFYGSEMMSSMNLIKC